MYPTGQRADMNGAMADVPWGNLWRTAATTLLFFFLLVMPVAVFTDLDTRPEWGVVMWAVLIVAFVPAAVVVWSDRIRWIGDA